VEIGNEWPDFAPVETDPIPDAKLFSGVKAAKVIQIGSEGPKTKPVGTYPLAGSATDEAHTRITVRFIRCGAKHYPAC
jgi:hypothetical protein